MGHPTIGVPPDRGRLVPEASRSLLCLPQGRGDKEYTPTWIARRLETSWLNDPIVLGSALAARALFCPAFDPEVLITVSGDFDAVQVEGATGRVRLWEVHFASPLPAEWSPEREFAQ